MNARRFSMGLLTAGDKKVHEVVRQDSLGRRGVLREHDVAAIAVGPNARHRLPAPLARGQLSDRLVDPVRREAAGLRKPAKGRSERAALPYLHEGAIQLPRRPFDVVDALADFHDVVDVGLVEPETLS
ncbi:MAG: hypothetical protein KatS3mg082_1456 [Nitrospiraceae bacterium]|nr:MAG: hypothetical protein KatS3mg082_1456 [Nitrospiraceae bacterium]